MSDVDPTPDDLLVSAVLDGEARARLASLEAWQRIAREAESWAHETPA